MTIAQSTFVLLKLRVSAVSAVKWPIDDNGVISVTWVRVANVRPIFVDISTINQTEYDCKIVAETFANN